MGIIDTLQADIDYDIIDEFIGHYALMCDEMEGLILSLEKPDAYERNVGELFRIFHNIKSASGFMKLDRMNKASELVESVLEEARAAKGPASTELINWMLMANDMFNTWKNQLETNSPELSPITPKILNIPSKVTI
jgi:two-component system chemotaxis sensor kinase CheA